MIQQVNLYSEILNEQQKQSSIKLTAAILATVGLLCVSFSAYLFWHISTIKTELHQSQLTLNQEQARVNELLSKRPSQEPNSQLLSEIEHWQISVNEASQTLQLLAGRKAFLSQGFSIYLQALANQSNPEIWLSAILIDGQSRGLRLEGSTFKPEQIPQVLQQLQQEPAFKDQTFAKLIIQQSAKIVGQMDFVLSNSEQLLSEKNHAQ
jgi:hypothetical protein